MAGGAGVSNIIRHYGKPGQLHKLSSFAALRMTLLYFSEITYLTTNVADARPFI